MEKAFNSGAQSSGKQAISGVILAGGRGQRAGGADKGLLLLDGEPLVAHVLRRLQPQVNALVISCNRNIERYEALAGNTVQDEHNEYLGPLAGISAAAKVCSSPFLAVVSCDSPHLPINLVSELRAALHTATPSTSVAYAHDGERDQYLFALIRRKALMSLPEFLASGGRAVGRWYQQHEPIAVDFSDRRSDFRNYNYRDDNEKARMS